MKEGFCRVPSELRVSHTSMAMNASPAKKPLTPSLAVPPLPKGEGEESKSQPSPGGEAGPQGEEGPTFCGGVGGLFAGDAIAHPRKLNAPDIDCELVLEPKPSCCRSCESVE